MAVGTAVATIGLLARCALPVELEVEGPDPLVLGEVEAVDVVLRAPETDEVAGRPLRLSVNVGSFGPVQRVEPGVYRSTYQLPPTSFPQVALVAAWRETGPGAEIRFFRIPLHGRTEVPVRARPGSEVSVRVEDVIFGPVEAIRGRAKIPIVVPPGVDQVTVVSERGDQTSQARVAAGVPPYNRLTLALTPYKVPSDGESFAILHAYVDHDPPLDPDRIRVTAPEGRFERLGAEGPVVRFRYIPERAQTRGEVTITGRVLRERVSRAQVRLELGLPVPERLVLQPSAERWVFDGSTPLEVDVLITDRLGLGVDGLEVRAHLSTGQIASHAAAGQGRYPLVLAPLDAYPPDGAVQLDVAVPRDDGTTSTETLRIPVDPPPWPTLIEIASRALLRDGQAELTWRAEDAAGAPWTAGGFRVAAEDLAVGPIEATSPGRYRAELAPAPTRRRVEVRVAHEEGPVVAQQTVRLTRGGHRLELGAMAGPSISDGLFFRGGVEVGYRLPLFEDRIAARTRISYFQREQTFDVTFTDGSTGEVDARLGMLPIGLGATLDLFRYRGGALYAGGFGLVAMAFERVDPRFEGPTERRTRIFGGAEAVLGLTWSGFFGELSGGALPVSASDLDAPDYLVGLMLGYRVGLF